VTAVFRPDWLGDRTAAGRAARRAANSGAGMVAAGLSLFVVLTVTAGLLIWDEAPTGPSTRGGRAIGAAGPSPGDAAPVDQLDRSTRTARVGPASLVLPGDPYRVHPDPIPLGGVLDLVFWAGATVHPRYDGRHDWSAAVLLGRMSATTSTGDLEQDGRRAVERLSTTFFGGLPTRVRDVTAAEHAVDGHPGVVVTATVDYESANLPSRHDTVTALLVRLEDGSVVLAASAVPDDTDPAVTREAAAALHTLRIR
jgi:hypothetical protein